jgi:hypothetical protein
MLLDIVFSVSDRRRTTAKSRKCGRSDWGLKIGDKGIQIKYDPNKH